MEVSLHSYRTLKIPHLNAPLSIKITPWIPWMISTISIPR